MQSKHSASDFNPVVLAKVPGGQSVGLGVPFKQYFPVGHGLPVIMSVGVGVDERLIQWKPLLQSAV